MEDEIYFYNKDSKTQSKNNLNQYPLSLCVLEAGRNLNYNQDLLESDQY